MNAPEKMDESVIGWSLFSSVSSYVRTEYEFILLGLLKLTQIRWAEGCKLVCAASVLLRASCVWILSSTHVSPSVPVPTCTEPRLLSSWFDKSTQSKGQVVLDLFVFAPEVRPLHQTLWCQSDPERRHTVVLLHYIISTLVWHLFVFIHEG